MDFDSLGDELDLHNDHDDGESVDSPHLSSELEKVGTSDEEHMTKLMSDIHDHHNATIDYGLEDLEDRMQGHPNDDEQLLSGLDDAAKNDHGANVLNKLATDIHDEHELGDIENELEKHVDDSDVSLKPDEPTSATVPQDSTNVSPSEDLPDIADVSPAAAELDANNTPPPSGVDDGSLETELDGSNTQASAHVATSELERAVKSNHDTKSFYDDNKPLILHKSTVNLRMIINKFLGQRQLVTVQDPNVKYIINTLINELQKISNELETIIFQVDFSNKDKILIIEKLMTLYRKKIEYLFKRIDSYYQKISNSENFGVR